MKTTILTFTRAQFDSLRDMILTNGKPAYDEANQGDCENGPEAPDYLGHQYNEMTAWTDTDDIIEICATVAGKPEILFIVHPDSDPAIVAEIQNGPQF